MAVYIIGFTSSTLLLASSNKIIKKQRWFLVMLALLIPCLIAGLRDRTIGTDVQVYLAQMTDAAISASNFKDYLNTSWYMIWRYLQVSDYEIGFVIIVYFAAKLFNSIFAVQFVLQALVVFPLYIAIVNLKGEYTKWNWLCFLTYYLLIYNTTLNMMRQSIAMAFILLAFSYLANKNKRSCALFTVIAILFHTSALLGIPIFFLYDFVRSDRQKSFLLGWKRISGYYANMVFAISAGILFVVCVQIFIAVLNKIGLSKYVGYISGNIRLMPNQIISRLPMFLLVVYAWRKGGKQEDFRFYFTIMCFDLLLSQFTSVNSFAGRIAMYFSQFEIFLTPMVCTATKKKTVMFLLISYMAFYWWFYFVLSGANATVPYVLGF